MRSAHVLSGGYCGHMLVVSTRHHSHSDQMLPYRGASEFSTKSPGNPVHTLGVFQGGAGGSQSQEIVFAKRLGRGEENWN
jgi:hypothetical protein